MHQAAQHALQANAESLDRHGVVHPRGADGGGQVHGAQRLMQAGVGLYEVLATKGLPIDRQSLAEAQEGALGRAGGLIPQLGMAIFDSWTRRTSSLATV